MQSGLNAHNSVAPNAERLYRHFGFPSIRVLQLKPCKPYHVSLQSMHPLRSLRSKGLSVLAMLVLLLGTAAPALARMTCIMGGPSILSVGQAEDCSPVDHAHPITTVQGTCCEVLQANPQRSSFVPASSAMVPVLVAVVLRAVIVPAEIVAPVILRDARFSRPPPLARSQRLATFGTFLI